MTVKDEKYMVFKREDLENWFDLSSIALEDAVVIRTQDVFAPPALDSYANSISTAIEVLRSAGNHGEMVKQLQEICDYFHQRANEAWQTNRKVPD